MALRLRLAWWNTGMAPRAKPRREAARYDHAKSVIEGLVCRDAVGVLGLGEITAEDLACCQTDAVRAAGLEWYHLPEQNERATALAVAFPTAHLQLVETRPLVDTFDGNPLTTGLRLKFELVAGGEPLHVIVVHWPSHLVESAARKRSAIGASLQRTVVGLRAQSIVVMGDFNDEPFAPSLSDSLLAYRDRDLVRRHDERFYNPFWRMLGERQHLEHESAGRAAAGTYYYRSGGSSDWHTYDQIVVSSTMVNGGPWTLIEAETRVWQEAPLLTAKGRILPPFDHLPVLGTIVHA